MVSRPSQPIRPTGTAPLTPPPSQTGPLSPPASSPASQLQGPIVNVRVDSASLQQRLSDPSPVNSLNFPDVRMPSQPGPSRDEILNGKILGLNQTSSAMPELRKKLSQLGLDPGEAKDPTLHGESTAQQVFNFRLHQLQASGQSQAEIDNALEQSDPTAIDATTLRSIESSTAVPYVQPAPPAPPAQTWGRYDPAAGSRVLAAATRRLANGSTTGQCYYDVKRAVNNVYGPILSGESAFMAANQLARSPHFEERTGTQAELRAQLASLPEGAVVVWDRSPDPAKRSRGGGWEHGHISVSDGRGNEISDHRETQMNPHYARGNVRIFLPTSLPASTR